MIFAHPEKLKNGHVTPFKTMTEPDDPIIFAITEGDLQDAALRRIKRKLTDDEIYTAKKGIEAGLMFDICTVYTAAIQQAVESSR